MFLIFLYEYLPACETCILLLYWDQSAIAHLGASKSLSDNWRGFLFHADISGLHPSTVASLMG